jgi:hypothetical protein
MSLQFAASLPQQHWGLSCHLFFEIGVSMVVAEEARSGEKKVLVYCMSGITR